VLAPALDREFRLVGLGQRLRQPDRATAPPRLMRISMTAHRTIYALSQPRRPGADRPTVRALDRSLIHSRRSRRRPPSALHAGPRRRSLQSRHEGEIRTPHQNRKTPKSRPDRDHAKACRPRKCPPKGKSHLDAKNRLINTDTLDPDPILPDLKRAFLCPSLSILVRSKRSARELRKGGSAPMRSDAVHSRWLKHKEGHGQGRGLETSSVPIRPADLDRS
jgi:hypothetical protein